MQIPSLRKTIGTGYFHRDVEGPDSFFTVSLNSLFLRPTVKGRMVFLGRLLEIWRWGHVGGSPCRAIGCGCTGQSFLISDQI